MLTTRAIARERDSDTDAIMFQILFDGKMFHEFEYPLMSRSVLKMMIAGQDAQDQNDEGFFINLHSGTVGIEINANSDVYESSRYTLSLEVCMPAFEAIAEFYPRLIKEDCERFGGEYHEESERDEEDQEADEPEALGERFDKKLAFNRSLQKTLEGHYPY